MNLFLLITTAFLISNCSSMIPQLYSEEGQEFSLQITRFEAKTIKRSLNSGDKQIWSIDLNSWIDEKTGEKINTPNNYTFSPPGTIIFKKITGEDAGYYSYEPLNEPKTSGPQPLDRSYGIRLDVLTKI